MEESAEESESASAAGRARGGGAPRALMEDDRALNPCGDQYGQWPADVTSNRARNLMSCDERPTSTSNVPGSVRNVCVASSQNASFSPGSVNVSVRCSPG